MRGLLVLVVAVAIISLLFFAYQGQTPRNPAFAEVSIGGRSYNVYLAITPEQQQRGLMNVTSIGNCNGYGNCLGMLFVDLPSPACFWMKDTMMPLEQYWINDNKISYAWTGIPESTNVVCEQGKGVLETNTSTNFTTGENFSIVREFG